MNLRKTLARLTGSGRCRPRPQPAAVPGATAHRTQPLTASGNNGPVSLAQEILARLLLELPGHHAAFVSALADGDYGRLGQCAHKLAGAVAYCELPALAAALKDLRQALGARDTARIHRACQAATGCMNTLMAQSGIRLP